MFGLKVKPREENKQVTEKATKEMFAKEKAVKKKATSKHLKHFNEGIDLFYQGVRCPIEDNAIRDGWLCAAKILEVKNEMLLASRKSFNLV
jgi:hypothetical protein